MATLNWRTKDGKQKQKVISKPITTIGESASNDISIPDLGLDDYHIQVIFDGRDFNINGATSDNEFYINGKKKKRARLVHKNLITAGKAEITFEHLSDFISQSTQSVNEDVRSLKRLQQLSFELFSLESVDEILEKLMDSVIELTGAAKGFLIIFEDGEPLIKVARNLKRENMADAIEQLSDTIIATVVETKKAMIITDAKNSTKFAKSESILSLNLSSVLCVPLLQKHTLLGIIYLGNDTVTGLFESNLLETLNIFAAQASLIVHNALLLNDLKLENKVLSTRLESDRFGEITGASKAMESVFSQIEKVAPTEVSVLISGETGTGKELIAREIHKRSNRKNGVFITVNCGAIPENLMESEFFGHVKGAFTGAERENIGKFQAANGGTLFLDEIGEMPIGLQVKILRALQERQVTKVGSTKSEQIDIRVLSATNKELEDEIKKGTFREDLFYRLNVIHISLPPLRKRDDDVVLLARYLLNRYCQEFDSGVKSFSNNAVTAIKKHEWPGNVREMENRIKKGIILSEGQIIDAADLDLQGDDEQDVIYSLAVAKENFQRDYILNALKRNDGNRAHTARELDVDPRTIYRYLEKV
ncbi:MAG: sigma 54-interacting transcriptional regulator [Deltaproteobacteria bacterium]|nr:sigma 54-interacting transcriptional regulator [Deltaproteobacteria bacterium]